MVRQKAAGFWIRIITMFLDLFLALGVSVGFSFLFIDNGSGWHFKEPYMFYLWIGITLFLLIFLFAGMPSLTKGKTLAMYITRTKIEFKHDQIFNSILRREFLTSFAWVFIAVFIAIFINHTLIDKFATSDQDSVHYSDWETIRVSVVTTIGSVLLLIQMICYIGTITRQDKCGFHDRISSTRTVWVNKHEKIKDEEQLVKIAPRPINNVAVEWIKE